MVAVSSAAVLIALAMGWMLASAVTFVSMMTLVKFLGSTYSTPLETFFRQLAMFIVLLPVILKNGPKAFAATRPGIEQSAHGAAAGTLGFWRPRAYRRRRPA